MNRNLQDLEMLLNSDDAEKPPEIEGMSEEFKEELAR